MIMGRGCVKLFAGFLSGFFARVLQIFNKSLSRRYYLGFVSVSGLFSMVIWPSVSQPGRS